jgi:RecA/RadA recombinase
MLNLVGGNFNNWAKIRPLERQLIDAMLRSPAHILVTMRSKADYVDGTGSNGKSTKVKVGTKAVMAEGIEYEFDIAGQMELSHILTIEKSRCKALQDTTWSNPGLELADQLKIWLAQGNAAVDQSVNEFKSAQELQPALFKEAYTSAGMEREAAIAILKRFGVDHPKFLSPEQFQDCIQLIKESAA